MFPLQFTKRRIFDPLVFPRKSTGQRIAVFIRIGSSADHQYPQTFLRILPVFFRIAFRQHRKDRHIRRQRRPGILGDIVAFQIFFFFCAHHIILHKHLILSSLIITVILSASFILSRTYRICKKFLYVTVLNCYTQIPKISEQIFSRLFLYMM